MQAGSYAQAARIGPDGVTLGPNNAGVTAQQDDTRDQTDISLKNVKLGPQGLQFNAGSRTNTSVSVSGFLLPLSPFSYNPTACRCNPERAMYQPNTLRAFLHSRCPQPASFMRGMRGNLPVNLRQC